MVLTRFVSFNELNLAVSECLSIHPKKYFFDPHNTLKSNTLHFESKNFLALHSGLIMRNLLTRFLNTSQIIRLQDKPQSGLMTVKELLH